MNTSIPSEQSAILAQSLQTAMRKLRRRLRQQSTLSELSASQLAVLHHLENEGAETVSALARSEGIRPQSMAAIVNSLMAAGFITGNPDPNDGRQTLLSLTDAWYAWVMPRRALRKDWLTRSISASLSEDEQETLSQAISLINRLTDDASNGK
ncbi:hypothetical protein A9B99_10710 [Mangrovibacter phragmitis]|jgi:DNA-binding MarR family transcriptional regulator|uniref:HTH marR-type domain-containing protein n=1 Tax=Mangrovibacter phragmitis TaxID=1691903 RepID=A0A1B7L0K5_9ENTR|nr:MarR family transcriptional regulator [Mangrovibacter phragmitis]OAT75929.1 hypothetical protein A9B99_10710 [Mangrovibacter phragmitis]